MELVNLVDMFPESAEVPEGRGVTSTMAAVVLHQGMELFIQPPVGKVQVILYIRILPVLHWK